MTELTIDAFCTSDVDSTDTTGTLIVSPDRSLTDVIDDIGNDIDVDNDDVTVISSDSVEGYQRGLKQAPEFERVIIDRLPPYTEVGGISRFVSKCVEAETDITIVADAIEIDSDGSTADVVALLAALDRRGLDLRRDVAAADIDDRTDARETWDGGRPPFGFEVSGGDLVPVDNFVEIKEVLSRVDNGDLSKSEASDILGCSRRTINRALSEDRREFYGLDG